MVGTNGSIAHFDGVTWQKLESGTTVDLIDVYGTSNSNIWIAGMDLLTGQRSVLFQLNGNSLRKAYEYQPPYRGVVQDTLTGVVTSVWVANEQSVWVNDGGRIWKCPSTTNGEGKMGWIPNGIIGFMWGLRGSAENNMVAVGEFGTIAHYNGSSWHEYDEFSDPTGQGMHFKAVAVSKSQVFAVGYRQGRATILRGSR